MFSQQFQSCLLLSLLAITQQAYANCAHGTALSPRAPNVPVSSFSYDDLHGPLNWFNLNKTANHACQGGTNQSPIVITDAISQVAASSAFQLTIPDLPNGAEFENLGTTVEVILNGTLLNKQTQVTYKLAQFHFHTPGEHRVKDEFFPLEMHMVFQSPDKKISVIGFLVELCEESGCSTPLLKSVLSKVGKIATPGTTTMTGPLSFKDVTRQFTNNNVWRYSGSLTTPPCAEQIDWIVSTKYLSIDLRTWLAVKKVIKYNARYTQDTPGRVNLLQNVLNEATGTEVTE